LRNVEVVVFDGGLFEADALHHFVGVKLFRVVLPLEPKLRRNDEREVLLRFTFFCILKIGIDIPTKLIRDDFHRFELGNHGGTHGVVTPLLESVCRS